MTAMHGILFFWKNNYNIRVSSFNITTKIGDDREDFIVFVCIYATNKTYKNNATQIHINAFILVIVF